MELISALMTLIAVIAGLSVTAYAIRVPVRFLTREIRRVVSGTGKMSWYRMVPESRRSNRSEASPESQVARVEAFVSTLPERFPFWFRRPTVTFAWMRNNDDGLWSLYIGVDRINDGTTTASVESLASGLNCRAQPVEHRPDFDHQDISVAYITDEMQIKAKPVPDELGSVANNLSNSGAEGTFMVTMEFMRPQEKKQLARSLTADAQKELGASATFAPTTSINAQTIKATATRTIITASSRDGDSATSENILATGVGSMSNLAFQVDPQDPRFNQTQTLMFAALPVSSLTILGYFFIPSLFGTLALVIGGVLPLAMLGLSLLGGGLLHRSWYKLGMARGEVPIPSYTMLSPSRAMRSLVHKKLNINIGTDTPSTAEVIPMYSTPMTQLVSISGTSMSVDVQSEPVPMEGFSSRFDGVDNDDLFLGMSGTGQISTISVEDLHYPIFICGGSGSGKSNTMMVILAGLSRISRRNSRGYEITPVWSETKGEGALEAWEMVKDHPGSLFVEAHNPKSEYRFAMEGRRLSEGATVKEVTSNASVMVYAMQNAWGESIKDASLEALSYSLQAALLMSENDIYSLDLGSQVDAAKPNVIKLMYLLLGGDLNYDPAEALVQLIFDLDKELDEADRDDSGISDEEFSRMNSLYAALTVLRPYADRNDPRYREMQQRKAAPMNKLSQIVQAEVLWTPDPNRKDIYVGQVIGNFAPVVINFGKYFDPDLEDVSSDTKGGFDGSVSGPLARRFSLMYSFLMWQYIDSRCSGWEDRGRRVILIYDEVADVAADAETDGSNVIAEITRRGRSKGCAIYCAAQYPTQLPEQAMHAVFGFRTKIWYQLRNKGDATMVMEQLGHNTAYTEENLKNLPMQSGIGIAELKKGPDVTSAFTLKSPEAHLWSSVTKVSSDLGEAVRRYESERDEIDASRGHPGALGGPHGRRAIESR